MKIPEITLDARDIHVPPVLKSLAAKHRSTNPQKADELDRAADDFAKWRRDNPRAR